MIMTPNELRQIREEFGATKHEMAILIGISDTTYRKWENNKNIAMMSEAMSRYVRLIKKTTLNKKTDDNYILEMKRICDQLDIPYDEPVLIKAQPEKQLCSNCMKQEFCDLKEKMKPDDICALQWDPSCDIGKNPTAIFAIVDIRNGKYKIENGIIVDNEIKIKRWWEFWK